MNITRENIAPFLDEPIESADYDKVDAWLTAISAILTSRYGSNLPEAVAPAVYDIVAQSITRRLNRGLNGDGGGTIKRQATGPSNVEYNTALTALSGWFRPDETSALGDLFGSGGTLSSVRTPAPDGIRYGNLARSPLEAQNGFYGGLLVEDEWESELGEGDAS